VRTFLDSATGLLVKPICGDRLQAQLNHWSPTYLALIGHGLMTGEYALAVTTPRQTAALVGQSMALLRTVWRASALEECAMKRGDLTVETLHKEQLANRRPSDADIDRFIERAGACRVFDGLDRATRPNKAPASNGHAANDNGNGNGGVAMPAQLSL
jgi:hypothetical protein